MDILTTDLDWETFSESSSSEDQEEIDFIYGGQAQSILSHLEDSIEKIDDFLSFERSFFHGDVVYSLSDQFGQMGRVTNIDMYVDLENAQGKVLKNINSKEILKIRPFSEGDYVIKVPWLGLVQRVIDKVTVLFDDGAKCEVIAFEREMLLPLTGSLLEDSQYPYYPGQRVKAKSSIASKSARWLCGTWRSNQGEGTVCAVKAGLVHVNWLASVLLGSNLDVIAPPCWQDSKNLTLLSCFSHAHWQLGDWCMLPAADLDEQMELIFQDASTGNLIKENKMTGELKSHLNSNIRELFIIGKIKTKVDVLWQNGEQSMELDPQTLLPSSSINTHEFWPMQFVLEKGGFDDSLKPSNQRWGVVQCADAKEHIVKVQWKTVSISMLGNLAENKMEETVSAYELIEHPDYSYCFGDIVFKVAQIQLDYQVDEACAKSVINSNAEAALRDENRNIYLKELHDNFYLSCVGNVIGFKDGSVEVKWATGLTTKVAPYEILQVDRIEGSTASLVPYEANDEELTQGINDHRNLSMDQKEKGLSNVDGREHSDKNPEECSSFSLSRAAVGLLSSIKASIFQKFGVGSHSSAVSLVPTSVEGNEPGFQYRKNILENCDLCTEFHPMSKFQSTENRTPNQEVIRDNEDFPVSLDSHQFKQFDILCNCSDHHFFEERKGLTLSEVKRSWVKKVQQEWSILERNLPATIFVRVFEERMNLFRAAIVGAPGTPYHDGLFFFDIYFPPEYPNEPPMVHYNSGGLRLNPNLYESGKVCLSLLNTWTGTGTEVWNPGTSTVLQVLLSLQALVLNEKPYFNEAGFDQQIGRAEGEKNSVSYNENAFLVTCKSMLYILKRPPRHFEALVKEHFSQRSQSILNSCIAYLEGAPLAFPFECQKTEHEAEKGTSKGFKIMIAKLVPKLVEAFSNKGIDCSQFVQLQDGFFNL